ncbi:hypothetical protein FPV67DRAFT_1484117 [Lyophyllum atratum]|nr:hypothetical protein FPV67DRAFT_1484117 [Lyophyllum atratum]
MTGPVAHCMPRRWPLHTTPNSSPGQSLCYFPVPASPPPPFECAKCCTEPLNLKGDFRKVLHRPVVYSLHPHPTFLFIHSPDTPPTTRPSIARFLPKHDRNFFGKKNFGFLSTFFCAAAPISAPSPPPPMDTVICQTSLPQNRCLIILKIYNGMPVHGPGMPSSLASAAPVDVDIPRLSRTESRRLPYLRMQDLQLSAHADNGRGLSDP